MVFILYFLKLKDSFISLKQEHPRGRQAINLISCPGEENDREKAKKGHALSFWYGVSCVVAGCDMVEEGL